MSQISETTNVVSKIVDDLQKLEEQIETTKLVLKEANEERIKNIEKLQTIVDQNSNVFSFSFNFLP